MSYMICSNHLVNINKVNLLIPTFPQTNNNGREKEYIKTFNVFFVTQNRVFYHSRD